MTVLAEVKKSLMAAVVGHLIIFVLMFGYRKHTQRYYIAEASLAQELAEQSATDGSVAKPKSKKNETVYNPLEQFEAPVQRLTMSLSKARESVLTKKEAVSKHMATLNLLASTTEDLLESAKKAETAKVDDNNVSGADMKSSLSNWRDLLSVGSLREIPDDELQNSFDKAAKEIMALVEFDDDQEGNKLAKQFLFDTGLGANIVKEPSEFVCPEPLKILTNGNNNDEIHISSTNRYKQKDAAYESDLQRYLWKLEQNFGNRIQARGIHALLPKSVEFAEVEIEISIDEVVDDIVFLANDLKEQLEAKNQLQTKDKLPTETSCIDPQFVDALVSAGLNAQIAQADVQQALRKSISRYDPGMSVEEIILDADLGSNDRSGFGPIEKTINLRSTIDSPLLMKSIDWIDALVEVIGGYSDELDQYVDSLTVLHGTTSVGEIMVESILEKAGRVGDINLQKYLDTVQNILQSITGAK
jgi:hypothetical protein